MHPALAQGKEAVDAVAGWGTQLPALGLGVFGMGLLVYLFLKYLAARDKAAKEEREAKEKTAREEREARDALFTTAIQECSTRTAETAAVCHETQKAATERERQTAELLGSVKGALERSTTVTQDVGEYVRQARLEIERSHRG